MHYFMQYEIMNIQIYLTVSLCLFLCVYNLIL